jgi:hypothetical protein
VLSSICNPSTTKSGRDIIKNVLVEEFMVKLCDKIS